MSYRRNDDFEDRRFRGEERHHRRDYDRDMQSGGYRDRDQVEGFGSYAGGGLDSPTGQGGNYTRGGDQVGGGLRSSGSGAFNGDRGGFNDYGGNDFGPQSGGYGPDRQGFGGGGTERYYGQTQGTFGGGGYGGGGYNNPNMNSTGRQGAQGGYDYNDANYFDDTGYDQPSRPRQQGKPQKKEEHGIMGTAKKIMKDVL
ncbi:hypothetical protein CC1G_04077 [Coprinopsis cinerea okayama7|uniref:Uncharacterized protein n=1 Tax=Coprinopsis cinerea (strain Okayama-7 / 130 / ATCC MYA-4618 / FGSC 9003) TaxID=240176 RepID=A8NVV8_COPC7|nr:hypothetical protein CC1G_04077 [Coprinopsis cinerea okayama7\|eukprot:XP_001836764.1 hypothetical protein CC1G_04077 [Coprinopsis cinerea okayama7\